MFYSSRRESVGRLYFEGFVYKLRPLTLRTNIKAHFGTVCYPSLCGTPVFLVLCKTKGNIYSLLLNFTVGAALVWQQDRHLGCKDFNGMLQA